MFTTELQHLLGSLMTELGLEDFHIDEQSLMAFLHAMKNNCRIKAMVDKLIPSIQGN